MVLPGYARACPSLVVIHPLELRPNSTQKFHKSRLIEIFNRNRGAWMIRATSLKLPPTSWLHLNNHFVLLTARTKERRNIRVPFRSPRFRRSWVRACSRRGNGRIQILDIMVIDIVKRNQITMMHCWTGQRYDPTQVGALGICFVRKPYGGGNGTVAKEMLIGRGTMQPRPENGEPGYRAVATVLCYAIENASVSMRL